MYELSICEGISGILGGGPLSPVPVGQRVSVQKLWLVGSRPWLTITHPLLEEEATYRVLWLFRGAQGTYAVLELEPGWMDEETPSDRTLVKILGPESIQTLTPAEFAEIMPDLAADVRRRQTLDLTDVEAAFGNLARPVD